LFISNKMSKPLVLSSNNGPFKEDEIIANLITRINDLMKEINKLSDISNEAVENNILWFHKYEKLKELYLKNINDELTLEDLISGKINSDEIKVEIPLKSPKESQFNDQEQKFNELLNINKELERNLLKGKEDLILIKAQYNSVEPKENDDNELQAQRNLERKYQGNINDILLNDFNKLKEEKKKMEAFYQKKLKDFDVENSKKKRDINKPEAYQIPSQIEQLNNNIAKFPKNQPEITINNDNKLKPLKGFNELETIKEIQTNERIEMGFKEENLTFKSPTILEVNEEKEIKIPKKNPANTSGKNQIKQNTNKIGKKETIKKNGKK